MSQGRGRLPVMSARSHSPAAPSWVTGPLLGFDTKTTGVDPLKDHLVTAAVVSRGSLGADGARGQDVRTWLADPGVEIPEAAAAVHGITTERARTEGVDNAHHTVVFVHLYVQGL